MDTESPREVLRNDVSLAEVQELVRRGEVDVKETDCDGNNILHRVCSFNLEKPDIVEYLISVGGRVNQVNTNGRTPLMECATKGYLETLRVLLNHGAYVDLCGPSKRGYSAYRSPHSKEPRNSAVLLAAENSNENCVTELLKHDADIWYTNDQGFNLLVLLSMKGLSGALAFCLKRDRVHSPKIIISALQQACKNGHIDCLTILLDEYGNIPDDEILLLDSHKRYTEEMYMSPILTAADAKHENCVFELLVHGCKITSKNSKDQSLFMIAAEQGLLGVVKKCLTKLDKSEILKCDQYGLTALMYACKGQQYECLEELLKSGKFSEREVNKITKSGFTALRYCAQNGFLKGLKLLIQHKADINYVHLDSNGYSSEESSDSALLTVAKSGQEQCMKELIDHGGNIWHRNSKGKNLLMVACANGLLETVKSCLSCGTFVQITETDAEGNTAFCHAFEKNQMKCMRELLTNDTVRKFRNDLIVERKRDRYVADRNRQPFDTFLHIACRRRVDRPDLVELLVSNCTLIDTFDYQGYTPLMYCAQQGFLESLKVLVKHGASLDVVQLVHDSPYSISRERYQEKFTDARNNALLMATEGKHQECAIELIDCGADLWHLNKQGKSVLLLAASKGLTKVVSKCVSRLTPQQRREMKTAADINKALQLAIENQHEECAFEIISFGADVWYTNEHGQNALMMAATNGLTNLVRKCVREGIVRNRSIDKTDRNGRSALTLALRYEHYNCAREIPDKNKRTPHEIKELNAALQAIFRNNYDLPRNDVIKALVLMGASDTPWAKAAFKRDQELTLDLISHGVDITRADEDGLTVLMAAAEKGLQRLVKLCLEVGSESFVNMMDKHGKNALAYACKGRQTLSLKQLIRNPKCRIDKSKAIEICQENKFLDGVNILENCVQPCESLGFCCNEKEEDLLLQAYGTDSYSEYDIIDAVDPDFNLWYTNGHGRNVLMIAVERGLYNVVRYCIDRATFSNLHAVDSDDKTAFTLACRDTSSISESDLICLSELLHSNVAFTCQESERQNKHTDINAQLYGKSKSLMQYVCSRKSERADLVEALASKGASLNVFDSNGMTTLMLCAKQGHHRSLKVLLQAGAEINATKNEIAMPIDFPKPTKKKAKRKKAKKQQETCYLFREVGSDKNVDCYGDTPVNLAAKAGNQRCVTELISYGADIWVQNSNGENLLMIASAGGLFETVKYCLDYGLMKQINARDKKGYNAVMHACLSSQITSLKLLMSRQESQQQVNVPSVEKGIMPLMVAAYQGRLDIMESLLAKGAEPNIEDKAGVTCLMVAVGQALQGYIDISFADDDFKRFEMVKMLLQHRAKINHASKKTVENALTIAVTVGAPDILIEYLVKEGADINHSDCKGKTPLSIACNNYSPIEMIKLFLNKGAKLSKKVEHYGYRKGKRGSKIELSEKTRLIVLAGIQDEHLMIKGPEAKDGVIPKLYDICRIPARQHVMNLFPNSNLFHMIPRLILPRKMKEFLLFDFDPYSPGYEKIPDLEMVHRM